MMIMMVMIMMMIVMARMNANYVNIIVINIPCLEMPRCTSITGPNCTPRHHSTHIMS